MSFKINMPKIDLNPQDWNEVCHILRNHVPEYTVWAFGSRVKWTAKAYSDLDLAIITQKPLSLTSMANIKEAFDESNLSIRVDIVDWATTSEVFRKIIEQDKVVIQVRREIDSDNTSEWKSYRLSEAGKIVTGKTPLTNNPENQGNEFPFITPADFVGNKWITKTIRTISKIGAASVKNCLVPKETVLVTCIGSDMGKAALSAMQCVTNQQINSIIVDTHKFLPEFIYYNLSIRQQEIKSMAGGSAVPILKKSAFSDIWLECPNLKTQKEIVATLAIFDDRIALLRETNTTLEAIAQALFKSWFVDFDPVHANAALLPSPSGRGAGGEGAENETLQNSLPHPNPLPKGEGAVLPSKIAALFPDSFEESELGLVPNGWLVTTLADAFEINPKRTLKKGTIAPYLEMAKLATSGHCVETPIQREMGSGAKFRNGDTLLARITPCLENGKSAFVDFLQDDQIGWGSTEFLVLRPKAPMSEYFGYLLCRHPVFREYAIQSMSGTSGRQRIQNDVLGRYLVTLPDDAVASVFTEVVDVIQKSIAGNHETAQTLATLRDTLLPRLISGQLRLPEATALLEETTA